MNNERQNALRDFALGHRPYEPRIRRHNTIQRYQGASAVCYLLGSSAHEARILVLRVKRVGRTIVFQRVLDFFTLDRLDFRVQNARLKPQLLHCMTYLSFFRRFPF